VKSQNQRMTKDPPAPGQGGGYSLPYNPSKTISPDAVWATSTQVCARYGGRSKMWLWRQVKNNPKFPKPQYFGRLQLYSVAALNKYDRSLKQGGER
jgi:hypothetical protein